MIHQSTVRIIDLGEKLFSNVSKETMGKVFTDLGVVQSSQSGLWLYTCPVFKHTLSFTILGAALIPVRVNGKVFIYGGGYAVQSINRLILAISDRLK